MKLALGPYIRFSRILLFPLAMIIYDFSAYLTTDLIQPGIIHIIREFEADVALAPASVSLYLAGGLALQWLLGPLSDRIGRRPVLLTGAIIFALACFNMIFLSSGDQYLIARFIQGNQYLLHFDSRLCLHPEAFDEKESIRIMALTSIVLLAPVIGPLAGAGLMNFLHWKLLFAIIGAMSLLAWALLIFNMPETVTSQGRGFRPGEVFSEFVRAFKQPVVLTGALALSFSNLPIITWVALSPVILIDDGGMSRGAYAWTQVPVFGGVIIASIIVARFIKDPTSPRFIWRTIPIQLTGLLVLLAGNIAWPHTWWWSVSGTSLYALGTGLLFPVLFRFALFSHSLPKGTVSATINIVALSFMAASVEVARWVYFQAGGRIAFHCLALIAGIVVIMLVSRLLKLRQQHLLQPA
ncbi:MFS transporter [Klebsiella pneumoniae]|nr:MFS transporter [Klebsiella pneumoniae]